MKGKSSSTFCRTLGSLHLSYRYFFRAFATPNAATHSLSVTRLARRISVGLLPSAHNPASLKKSLLLASGAFVRHDNLYMRVSMDSVPRILISPPWSPSSLLLPSSSLSPLSTFVCNAFSEFPIDQSTVSSSSQSITMTIHSLDSTSLYSLVHEFTLERK
jgi:hypothetical protein